MYVCVGLILVYGMGTIAEDKREERKGKLDGNEVNGCPYYEVWHQKN